MRISILGGSGKVGTALAAQVEQAPDLGLSEVISGTGGNGTIPLNEASFEGADILIDFSSPAGVMNLLDRLGDNPLALVIGSTGFSAEQHTRLRAEGNRRPILVGANFTKGFEEFALAAETLASAFPGAAITVGEVYNKNKKPAASGTTQRLCHDLGTDVGRIISTDIQRIGDTPGVNSVTLDNGVATLRLELSVRSRDAYAAGALDAARWLIHRPNGSYQPKDMISA